MRYAPIVPTLTITLSASIAACEPGEVTDVGPEVAALEEGLEAPDRILAEPVLEVEYGVHTLTFLESDDAMAVVEYAPASTRSLLDAFAAENATALEILRAISPDVDAPAALLRAHEASNEVSAATPSPVRDLSTLIAAAPDFDTYYYAVNCSYSSDHPDFRSFRQTLGWSWRWYKYTTPNGNFLQMSATTPQRKKLFAHTCNNGSDNEEYNWGVQRSTLSPNCSGGTMYWRIGIEPDHRAFYYQTGASKKCRYFTYAVNNIEDVPHALGIAAP